MKKVQILMSTYNGQQYLIPQIESIMKQEEVDVYLIIRDDGSSDYTKDIITQYQKKFPTKIRAYFEENIGVKKSFLRLIELSEDNMDYYAFSDQDDIWDGDKIKCAIKQLDNKHRPLVYGSNIKLFYESDIKMGKNYYNNQLHIGNFLVKNYFPGCTMVINKSMRKLIKEAPYLELQTFPLHDHWICLICTSCGGEICFDNEAHILYRQHQNNVVGYERGLWNKMVQNGLFSKEQRRYHIACELEKYYQDYFDESSKKIIYKISNYPKRLRNRVHLLFEKKISSGDLFQDFVLKILIIMKKF